MRSTAANLQEVLLQLQTALGHAEKTRRPPPPQAVVALRTRYVAFSSEGKGEGTRCRCEKRSWAAETTDALLLCFALLAGWLVYCEIIRRRNPSLLRSRSSQPACQPTPAE